MPAEKPIIRDLTRAGTLMPPTRSNLVGPHNEGARLVLECETSGGYPEPSLSWWRDGRLVDDTYELVSASDGLVLERRGGGGSDAIRESPPQVSTGDSSESTSSDVTGESMSTSSSTTNSHTTATRLIRNRLELAGPLTRDDLLANYSCQAWNSKLGEPPTSYAMIDMNRK